MPQGQNGGSVGSTHRQDDALSRRWETVPSLGVLSTSNWAAATGRSASTVCNLVATSAKTPMGPMWSCGAGLGGVGRLMSVQQRNQTRARLSARRESGDTVTHGDLTATAWRKAKTSSHLSAMVVNVSAVACFALPFFVIFLSSASTPPSISSSSSSPPLSFSPSFAHSVIETEKIFRSSPASDYMLRIAASVRNAGRRTLIF